MIITERYASDRDDMGGVGCFNRDCRTLYVSGMKISKNISESEQVIARHFSEWGPIEEISVKPKYGCVFVRYIYRCNAEFAKQAMSEQSLDGNEQINVRWAYDDPNPRVIRRIQAEKEVQVMEAIEKKGYEAAEENHNDNENNVDYENNSNNNLEKIEASENDVAQSDHVQNPTKKAKFEETSSILTTYPTVQQQQVRCLFYLFLLDLVHINLHSHLFISHLYL